MAGKEFPRIAGVSAFGAGGSNAHLIIEEFTKPIDNNSRSTIEIMVPLSARTMNRLVEYAERFVEFLERTPQESLNLVALAYTLQVGREHFDTRVGFIVRSVNELIAQLRSFIRGEDSKDCYLGSAKEGKQLVELFSNDVEMERILASWFLSSRYTKIIDCWVKGISVNWHNLYTHSIPGRIHLPTYPFARESYWVETQVEQSAVTDTSGQFQQAGNKKSYSPLQKPVNIALIDPNIFSDSEYKSDDHFIDAQLNDSRQLVSEDVKFVFNQQVDTVSITAQDTWSLLKNIEQQLVSSLAKALFLMHEDIELDKPFIDMGLDSIVAVEWIRDINSHYKTAIAATMFYEYPTINDFSKFIANELQKKSNVIANINDEIRQENTIQPEHTLPVNAVEAHVSTLNQHFDVSFEAPHDEEASLSIGVRNEIEEPIAIIGMAGRYPGADNLDQYWENLLLGKSSINEVPKARWDIETHYDPRPGIAGKVYSKWLGALEDIDCFDAEFFRISFGEADEMDPQHRLFLQEGFRAFEDAAYSAEKLSSTRCGVYMGIMSSEYSSLLINNNAQIGSINNSYAIAAARLSYYLNLKGPAIPIDTACSSSLVATHLACQALRNKEIDMALAGGVSLYLTLGSYIGMCSARMLSTGPSCRAFDDRADGFVPGEGVGAVVLKRLIDAERDGDRIHAKIIASGINHDGRTNGLSAPNGASQRELLKGIYQSYAIDPASISYIEAHGTGTRLGDAIELEALSNVLKTDGRALNSCAVGSVKTNLGHTSAASGMSSLHKVVLSIKNSMFVPTIGVEQANSFFSMEDSPLYIVTDCKPWTKTTALRRAGVNAFGFSGTNAHIVVEEYISGTERLLSKQDINFYLIPFSATNHESLVRNAYNFYVALQANQLKNQPLMDIAYTLQTGREAFKFRVAFVANSVGQLEDELATFLKLGGLSYPDSHNEIEKKEYSSQMEFNRHFGSEQLMKEIANDWIGGKKINWLSLYDGLRPQIISLPGYCFQKTHHWVDAHRPQGAPNVDVGELSPYHETATVVDKDFHAAISYLKELVGKYIDVNPKDIVIEKNFIELGVKSVGIMKIAQQLRLDIDKALQPTLMYEYSNIMALAKFLAEQYSDRLSRLASTDMNSKSADRIISSLDEFPELIHLNSEYDGTPIFWIHGGMGGVQPYFEIAKYIRRPFFGIQAVGYQTDKTPIEGISAIAACYINIIKQVQPNGPYELGGYSLGGLISYEMIRQLQQGGEIVKTLVMLDTIAPFPHEGEMSNKTAMLQAANLLIATSNYDEQFYTLIHRDELHAELTDEEFTKRLVSLMAQRGVVIEADHLRKMVEKTALVHKSYQFERAKIIALGNPEELECYYFRNKSNLFWGDGEPYYYFDGSNLGLDGRDYWSPWEKVIPKFTMIDVDSSSHMQILTDEASKKQVVDTCKKIYDMTDESV